MKSTGTVAKIVRSHSSCGTHKDVFAGFFGVGDISLENGSFTGSCIACEIDIFPAGHHINGQLLFFG